MDILHSAFERQQPSDSTDQPAFADLVAAVTHRVESLGTSASSEQVQAAVMDVVGQIAQFTLEWVEGEDPDIAHRTDAHDAAAQPTDSRYAVMVPDERW